MGQGSVNRRASRYNSRRLTTINSIAALSPVPLSDALKRALVDASATFARYEQQIAQEYVPLIGADAYRLGRRRFVEGLLARPFVFFTPHFDEAQARGNLRR